MEILAVPSGIDRQLDSPLISGVGASSRYLISEHCAKLLTIKHAFECVGRVNAARSLETSSG